MLQKCVSATSFLVCTGFNTREQNVCCATYFLREVQSIVHRRELAAGACCGSVLQEQAPSCVPAFTDASRQTTSYIAALFS